MHPLDLARTRLESEPALRETAAALSGGTRCAVSGLAGGLRALATCLLAEEARRPPCLIVPDLRSGHRLAGDLTAADRAGRGVALLPPLDADPYGGVPPHPDILRARVQALAAVSSGPTPALVVPARSLLVPLPGPETFSSWVLRLRRETDHDPARLRSDLLERGYVRQDSVSSRGEFASRGYILDVFPAGAEAPLRLEFFGDTLVSIRPFDPSTQRSVGLEAEEIVLPPMREYAVDEETVARWAEAAARAAGAEPAALAPLIDALRRDGTFPGYELLHWAGPEPRAGLEDYAAESLVAVLEPEACLAEVRSLRRRLDELYEERRTAALPPPSSFLREVPEVEAWLEGAPLHLDPLAPREGRQHRELRATPSARYRGDLARAAAEVAEVVGEGGTAGVLMETPGALDRFAELLSEREMAERIAWRPGAPAVAPATLGGRVVLGLGDLGRGFRLGSGPFLLLTDADLHAAPPAKREERRESASETFLSDLRDLRVGDLVVHADHGIGLYNGMKALAGPSGTRDFLVIEYQGGDRLYQPLERLDLVQKYSGVAGVRPRLDRMGGATWKRVKSRIRASVREMTRELLQLYARRMNARGHSFPPDTPWQREFEDSFPYETTPDQARATEEVKADMESPRPMDRLLVGDVGFGKTEVAMRAAMKAVLGGKQVAVLAPTTVLTFQHHRTFSERFSDFPARIDLLSRFRNRAEQKATIEALGDGRVDILIGTHRLLGKDVRFKDLGLLVVDEEQRFGVRHKERIKALKGNVDVLTMTATPIPRTLQMAFGGLRDLSVIRTPPPGRYAIQTEVLPFRKETVRGAVEREMERAGQVYFVHNRVASIYSMAAMVQDLVPGPRVIVAHGQMPEAELEETILAFVRGEADILVTTTIIENGVDIPRVNTIIVNRADRFGLAQLYQLRGRVGRGAERAYAYLLVPGLAVLSEVARKRLRALKEFSELGSGFRLAAMDLEIRGAGNLLGSQQSGHIAAVGFEMYCRLLERTAAEMRGEELPEEFETSVSLPLDLHLPDTWIPDEGERLSVYKRLVSARTEAEVMFVAEEVADRYGHPPDSLRNLVLTARIKLLAQRLHLAAVEGSRRRVLVRFPEETRADLDALVALVRDSPGATLSPEGVLEVRLGEGEDPGERAFEILEALE